MSCENDKRVINIYECGCCKGRNEEESGNLPTGTTGNVGEFFWWFLTTPPENALICDGSEVSRTDYSELFDVIGTNFGEGDEETTFNLPDLRGEFIRGYDIEKIRDPQGSTRNIGTHQDDALQKITGSFCAYSYTLGDGVGIVASSVYTPNSVQGGSSSQYNYVRYNIDSSRVARTDVETRPKNISLLPCIRYK